MTDTQKIQLIRRVLGKAFHDTESWCGEDHLGASLAYLCRAIAEGGTVDWPAGHGMYHTARVLFTDWFPPEDPVWQFIST